MPYQLKTIEIEVCGEKLVVSQASNVMDIRRSVMITESEKEGTEEDVYETYIRKLLYPSLVACTTGNVPTLDEFLNNLPVEESNVWVETAKELNARWFTFTNGEEVPDEKKEEPQTSSTPVLRE